MSTSDRELVNLHLQKLLVDAAERDVPDDMIGRLLLEAAVALWRKSRPISDIAAELEFTADNLDPDIDYTFIRP